MTIVVPPIEARKAREDRFSLRSPQEQNYKTNSGKSFEFRTLGFEVTVFGPTGWLRSTTGGRKEDRHKGVFLVQAMRGSVYL